MNKQQLSTEEIGAWIEKALLALIESPVPAQPHQRSQPAPAT
jgi:hypothetical protein